MTVHFVILAITAMVQDELRFLAPVPLGIFVYGELKYPNLTMIPLVGSAQEEAFVKPGSSQNYVHQVHHYFWLLLGVVETIVLWCEHCSLFFECFFL